MYNLMLSKVNTCILNYQTIAAVSLVLDSQTASQNCQVFLPDLQWTKRYWRRRRTSTWYMQSCHPRLTCWLSSEPCLNRLMQSDQTSRHNKISVLFLSIEGGLNWHSATTLTFVTNATTIYTYDFKNSSNDQVDNLLHNTSNE